MKILSYNVRGIGSRVKGRAIQNLIHQEKIQFACFQETKLAEINQSLCQLLWGNVEVEWLFSPAENRGGGLLCVWQKGSFVVEESTCTQRWISVRGRWDGQSEECVLLNVYAPCNPAEKGQLWRELIDLRRRSNVNHWCILGDFNSVRGDHERKGITSDVTRNRRDVAMFNDFIQSMDLVDVPVTGKRFTWIRPNGSAMSRLDRCLVSLEWLGSWPHSVQHVLDRDYSDHCPIILKHLEQNWGPKPFRVMNCWFLDSSFQKYVEERWGGLVVEGRGLFILKEKLKRLKVLLKQWNSEIFGDLNLKKKEIVKKLNDLDLSAETEQFSEVESNQRRELTAELWHVSNLHESLLCQKSRIRWLKEGDANTSFFHGIVNWKRRSNCMSGLNLDGRWEEQPAVVKEGVKEFFTNRFKESGEPLLNLDGVPFKKLSVADNTMLVAEFDLEEIREAVWDCDGNKSPGPDGYNFKFIKNFWDIIKLDVKHAVDDFYRSGTWPRGTNSSFIALIPKVESPQNLNEFRPISLVGCLYKIVSKILAARIKKVLYKVIDENQFAFLGGRSMLDSVIIANESIHEAKSSKLPSLIFKVDFEKAYDSIRWNFLVYMLRRLNFHEKWIQWVYGCLDSSFVSVLVNGSPTGEFKMEKGIRQGDPLAPFLFLVVAEGLNGIMKQAVLTKNFQPLCIGKIEKVEVSLLQFADDALFIGEASVQNVRTLKCILRCFELASGMRVNFHKSKLAGVSVVGSAVARFASLLNCRTMTTPFIYLGIQVGCNPRRLLSWDPVVQKLKNKLSSWKSKHLSFGGRVCLIKSVLTAIPLFYLSFFRMPKGVLMQCKQIMSRFLWGGSDEDRKVAWVKWNDLCKPKSAGGLGIRDLEWFNLALLGKWRWRLMHEKDQLWCKVLYAKYGDGQAKKVSIWWADLLKSCVGSEAKFWFENAVSRRIGEGDDTWFWKEDWLGSGKFCEVFADLFHVSAQQDLRVVEMGRWESDKWVWNFQWLCRLEDGCSNQLSSLLNILSSFSPVRGQKDKWSWIKEGNGIFSVCSAYEALAFDVSWEEEPCFKLLWKAQAPSNAIALGWKVLLDRIQTKDNLVHRNILIADLSCPLCDVLEERSCHLFFSCSVAWKIWGLIHKWLGFSVVIPWQGKAHLLQFVGLGSWKSRAGLLVIWLAVIWQIWVGRNAKLFRGEVFNLSVCFDQARLKAWLWLKSKNKNFTHALSEWFGEPLSCLEDM